jgi:hypothetical protein
MNEAGTIPVSNPVKVPEPGIYYIMATNQYGCSNIEPVELEFVEPYQDLEVAIVSVDSLSGKNTIYWNPPVDLGVEFINVYKKNYHSGEMDLLETVSDYSTGFFVDVDSDPVGSFESYAISVVDSCGNESDTSAVHKSINLVGALSGSAVNLLWNEYDGMEIAFYRINRKSEDGEWENISTVLGNTQIYSDADPGELPKTYVIEAIPRDSDSALNMNSFSNELRVVSTGINDFVEDKDIRIYPNPFNGLINIELPGDIYRGSFIEIRNVLGEVVYQSRVNESQITIPANSLPNGTYILNITGKEVFHRMLIK